MLGFLKSQQGAWVLTAGAAIGVAAVAAVGAWYGFSPASLPWAPAAPQTAIAGAAQPASTAANDAPSAAAPSLSAAAVEVTSKVDTTPPAAPAQRPEFDIVRVEPSGDSVIAGRGAPGATIALVDGDTTLASAVADANGEVVFLPPALAPGEHVLALQSVQTGAAPVPSSQKVTVVVPTASKAAPLVALTAPDKPTVILSDKGAQKPKSAGAPAASASAKAVPTVAIRTAEAEEGGSFFATGIAPPGSQSRLYLNGAFLAKVIADLNGSWAVKVEKGMRPGRYLVRADEVDPESGKVVARAEVPFNFPEQPVPLPGAPSSEQPAKSSGPGSSAAQPQPGVVASPGVAAAGSASAPTIIKEVRTATVIRGDSLWRISRKILGRGIRYTEIYEANASQIRNPRLVFPGQIFVVPTNPG